MKRRSLLIVVALLCMASLMAAMAYSSATVTSDSSFKITNTSDALLAMSVGEDHQAYSKYVQKPGNRDKQIKSLELNLANDEHGVQRNSIYTWNKLFKVTNNSDKVIKVEIYPSTQSGNNTVVNMKTSDSNTWTPVRGPHNPDRKILTFELGVNASVYIDTQLESVSEDLLEVADEKFDLVVNATPVVPVAQ